MPFGFSPYGNQILQKDALEEACQELPQHSNSQREQCINTATDKHSTSKKKVCQQHSEGTNGPLFFKTEKGPFFL